MSVWALIALGTIVWIGLSALIILFFQGATRQPTPPPWNNNRRTP